MDFTRFKELLRDDQVRLDEPMSRHTTFGIGGPADCFVMPETKEELCQIVRIISEEKFPYFILGGGANLLVRDKGIRGVVIAMTRMQNILREGNYLTVGAGVSTVRTAREALKYGLSGMEFASGIPGTLGGAAFMNAGAYDGEMSRIIRSVRACNMNGELHVYTGTELRYAYRHSLFMDNHEIITDIMLELTPKNPKDIKERMDDLNSRRRAKQPLEARSAGSTFKRPPGHYVGHMIETLGLKGFAVGDAAVSTKHAGFLINKGHASAEDVLNLIHEVQKRVKDGYNVEIEPEVRIVGER